MEDKQVKRVAFSAINPYIEIDIPEAIQKERRGIKYVPYGRDNAYPAYLLECYKNCGTLKAIVDGNVNFVLGDEVRFRGAVADDELMEQLRELVRDYYIFGYGFVQALANPLGEVRRAVRLPAEYVRTDKDHQTYWYSEKWNNGGSQKALIYPLFGRKEDGRIINTDGVLMFGKGRETYPTPLWSGVVKDVQIEREIDTFHLSELEHNFLTSCIINMNNGVPSDEEKEEIERNLSEKHGGAVNGGRIVICYNDNVQNRTTIERLTADNFDSRYSELARRSREQLFISFKAQPILFGLTSETNTGFSTNEFNELFKLYNKVMIKPVQSMLKSLYRKIYNEDVLDIVPFTL